MPIIITDAYVPPLVPSEATSADGVLKAKLDTVYGGVLLTATWPGGAVYKMKFRRDGVPVRSGDLAWAPGGVAVAYDHEAPLGATSSWTVDRYFRLNTGEVRPYSNTFPSLPVSLSLSDVDQVFDFWIKSISNPNLSMRLRSQVPDPTFSQTTRNSLVDLPSRSLRSGSWDTRLEAPRTLSFMTGTREERDALLALLGAGPVLVQSLRLYGIYDFYALPGDSSEAYFIGAFNPRRVHTIQLLPIDRPGTAGAPLYIPGHSYADVDTAYANYDALGAAVPSYNVLVQP